MTVALRDLRDQSAVRGHFVCVVDEDPEREVEPERATIRVRRWATPDG